MKFIKNLRLLAIIILLNFFPSLLYAGISILNTDGPGEGFNDSTAASSVVGNPGNTLGKQRLNVFQAAANYWSEIIGNNVPIVVEAQMNPLTCNEDSATLGSAGPQYIWRNFNNAPETETWYPSALANELAGNDLDGNINDAEIVAFFNSSVDLSDCLGNVVWWYGINADAPSGTLSLYDVVLHEIGHGLGFLTFVDQNGATFLGKQDHFMLHLRDHTTGKSWVSMTTSERANSSRNNNLVWQGSHVRDTGSFLNSGRTSEGYVYMYAPSPYEEGSSISHWDITLNPDELMEPYLTPSSRDVLTQSALCDIGWSMCGNNGNTPARKSNLLYHFRNTIIPAISGQRNLEQFHKKNKPTVIDSHSYDETITPLELLIDEENYRKGIFTPSEDDDSEDFTDGVNNLINK